MQAFYVSSSLVPFCKQISCSHENLLTKRYGGSATFLKAEGSYSGDEKDVVMCACNNKQMYSIRNAVKEIDPKAFIIIMESNEVLGEGFKPH